MRVRYEDKKRVGKQTGTKGSIARCGDILFSTLVVDVIDRRINDRIDRQFGDATWLYSQSYITTIQYTLRCLVVPYSGLRPLRFTLIRHEEPIGNGSINSRMIGADIFEEILNPTLTIVFDHIVLPIVRKQGEPCNQSYAYY
jgi:hypothetical protein